MSASHQIGQTLRVEFGYASPHFLDAASAVSVRHLTPWVSILAYPEVAIESILPLLETVAKTGRPLVLFCSDLPAELRAMLIVNNQQAALRCVAIDAPSRTEYDRASLFAIAAATGARIVASNHMLERTTLDMLGQAGSATVDALSTVLAGFPLLQPQ